MSRTKVFFFILLCTLLGPGPGLIARAGDPIVIAHRGASGYLPEHTRECKVLAHAMRADFLEQDVVLSKDDQPIVLHDIYLDTVTNVAEAFPDRRRADGRFYAVDFTLADLKSLHVVERFDPKTHKTVFPKRFPSGKSDFRITTLAEEIELIQGLNKTTGRNAGIYTEIKSPAWHRRLGKDITRIVLDTVYHYGYRSSSDNCYIQCFDPAENRRIRNEMGCKLRLIQLIDENGINSAKLKSPAGLKEIALYVDGIGPAVSQIVHGRDKNGEIQITTLVDDAHKCGLLVHPYTVRVDLLPPQVHDAEELLQVLFVRAKVDGLFADFPDRAVSVRDRLARQ